MLRSLSGWVELHYRHRDAQSLPSSNLLPCRLELCDPLSSGLDVVLCRNDERGGVRAMPFGPLVLGRLQVRVQSR